MQAELLWIADCVGELTLGQTIPLDNLSLMDCRALGMLPLSQEGQQGDHTPWLAALLTEASCLWVARQNLPPVPWAKALQDGAKGFNLTSKFPDRVIVQQGRSFPS